jgi:site-specific DNA recombinase
LGERVEGFNIRFEQEVKPLLDRQKLMQQSLAKVEKRAQRLLGLYEDELIGKQEFAKEKAALDSEKRFLEGELGALQEKINANDLANFDFQSTLSSIHNLAEVFEELDHQQRKELLRTVINKIEVGKHHLDCQIFALPKSFVDYDRTDKDSWRR